MFDLLLGPVVGAAALVCMVVASGLMVLGWLLMESEITEMTDFTAGLVSQSP